jgi:DNA-directed RNA polymerase subunit RPC12/RpoP
MTTKVSASIHDEMMDVFPQMSVDDWAAIVSGTPGIRGASGSSIRRRFRWINPGNMVVVCSDCGMEMEDFAEMVRDGGDSSCIRCGSNNVTPST